MDIWQKRHKTRHEGGPLDGDEMHATRHHPSTPLYRSAAPHVVCGCLGRVGFPSDWDWDKDSDWEWKRGLGLRRMS